MLKFQEDESKENEIEVRRETTWKRVEELAEKKTSGSGAVHVPHESNANGSAG